MADDWTKPMGVTFPARDSDYVFQRSCDGSVRSIVSDPASPNEIALEEEVLELHEIIGELQKAVKELALVIQKELGDKPKQHTPGQDIQTAIAKMEKQNG